MRVNTDCIEAVAKVVAKGGSIHGFKKYENYRVLVCVLEPDYQISIPK